MAREARGMNLRNTGGQWRACAGGRAKRGAQGRGEPAPAGGGQWRDGGRGAERSEAPRLMASLRPPPWHDLRPVGGR